MTFLHPTYLLLLLLLPIFILWKFIVKRHHQPSFMVASAERYSLLPQTLKLRFRNLPFWLRLLTLALLIIVLARPQTNYSYTDSESEGIDIMMVMDISTSMLATDIEPTRIEAAKRVAYNFINNRPTDNIGLTLFAGEAFTKCPLTTDHAALLKMFHTVSCDLQQRGIIGAGTAIGMGISSAINHLEGSKTKSKVVILLTDGENNTGEISPLIAAQLAQKKDIRIYTILLAGEGDSQQTVAILPNGEEYKANVSTKIDTQPLEEAARLTGGIFYKAPSTKRLKEIYEDIDQLERTKLKIKNSHRFYESYQPFAILALLTLLAEIILRHTWLRRFP